MVEAETCDDSNKNGQKELLQIILEIFLAIVYEYANIRSICGPVNEFLKIKCERMTLYIRVQLKAL